MPSSNSSSSCDDNNDPYDMSHSSYTDHSLDLATVEQYVAFLKIGNYIKENLVKQTQSDTATFLLGTLRAVINEQIEMGLIDREEGLYILDSIFDSCLRRSWVE